MATNLGKVTKFCAPSQELESERPPGPHGKPSAVGPRGSAPAAAERYSNSHATRDDCPCRECRHARRRAREVSLDPELALERFTGWRLVVAWVTAWLIGSALLIGAAVAIGYGVMWLLWPGPMA